MRPLAARLRAGDTLVSDGALGTMLIARGLRAGQAPESLNLSNPALLEAIAREYAEAGADIVATNTFGASPLRLRQHALEASTEAINAAAVEAVRRATAGRAYVAGDIGPCGSVLKPYGEVEPAEVAASYERQVRALAAAGVDVFFVETMTDVAEAVLAVRAARAIAPAVPIVATMTFEKTRRGFFTVMGTSIEQAARELAAAGADAVGSNCGNGIDVMIEVARQFRACTDAPIAIQSNAGLPERRGSELFYPEGPEYTAERAAELLAIGVGIIGGCCGTTPGHIRAIRRVVDSAVRVRPG